MYTRLPSLLLIGLLLTGFGDRCVENAAAQAVYDGEQQSPSTRLERSHPTSKRPNQGVGSVPDWAEPAPQSSNDPSPSRQGARTKGANFPDNPDKVPLGVPPFVLALAGIGYAVGRLRRTRY